MKSEEHLNILGYKAKDLVTGFSGTVTSISFDLYGCIQGLLTPEINDKGDIGERTWFDISRISIDPESNSAGPIIAFPDFSKGYISEGNKGPEDKPMLLEQSLPTS